MTVQVGDRIRVKSIDTKGKVTYIDRPSFYSHHLFPIQVELDEPYDNSGHTVYRTNLKDLRKIKKGRKKVGLKPTKSKKS